MTSFQFLLLCFRLPCSCWSFSGCYLEGLTRVFFGKIPRHHFLGGSLTVVPYDTLQPFRSWWHRCYAAAGASIGWDFGVAGSGCFLLNHCIELWLKDMQGVGVFDFGDIWCNLWSAVKNSWNERDCQCSVADASKPSGGRQTPQADCNMSSLPQRPY